MQSQRIVFAGTPEFARVSLQAVADAGYNVVAVYTQPDRPSGRGRRLTASPVKQFAEARGIAVLQPESLRDAAADDLRALSPDIMIVAAYGLLLPQAILDIPTAGCLNVHASLLPRWRGAAPIQAAILAHDQMTGVCLMKMTAGLDCGPVYVAADTPIGDDDTAGELHDRLAHLGGELLVRNLDRILGGEIEAEAQDDASSTYAAKIQKADAELDWSLPAEVLKRRVRAYNPVPGAWFMSGPDALRVKVWRASCRPGTGAAPGTFEQYDDKGIVVACGGGSLCLESLQLPGKGRVNAREFAAQIDIR